ncbi:MAG TPA: malic enzyme-like NAD(P)-binding protein [Steroidobacteraceae bacterium]|nr:malic enzyme-like NAD(P)-binding protein [Steroidobacteraceae bacterium]
MKVSEIFQVETTHAPGNLASVLNVIAEAGLILEHVSTIRRDQDRTLWELTVEMDESVHSGLLARLNALPSARFVGWSDRVFERHRGGKIEMRSRVAISSQQILRDIYAPGAARVCLAIQAAPEKALDFTYIGRTVAIVTDGSATAGLGNIGLRAKLPLLEGKAALFASLVGISGIPVLVESASVDHFVEVVCSIAPSFGAILLEDVGTPRCFEIEQKLRARLSLPVLHGDQHATAVVTLAALLNATHQTGTTLHELTVGVVGLGAAGSGIARLLHAHGIKQLLGNDLRTEAMGRLAQLHGQRESLEKILARADVVICTTGAQRLIQPKRIRKGQIVFALSTPDPEIDPAAALATGAAIAADGKSINSVLCFPGLFDAVLRARARSFTDSMLVAAAGALAAAAGPGQLLPDPLDVTVHERVSQAVQATVRLETPPSTT